MAAELTFRLEIDLPVTTFEGKIVYVQGTESALHGGKNLVNGNTGGVLP